MDLQDLVPPKRHPTHGRQVQKLKVNHEGECPQIVNQKNIRNQQTQYHKQKTKVRLVRHSRKTLQKVKLPPDSIKITQVRKVKIPRLLASTFLPQVNLPPCHKLKRNP